MHSYRACTPAWAIALLSLACNGDRSASSSACEGLAAERCGAACSASSDCGAGLQCSDGTCTAECAPGQRSCPGGATCSSDGRCLPAVAPPPGEDEPRCARASVSLEAQIPTVMLLIDFSGSMHERFGETRRWRAVKRALLAPQTGVIERLRSRVRFGAALYDSDDGNENPPCPRLRSLAPALDNQTAIGELFADEPSEDGDTPTAEAIELVAASWPRPDPRSPQVLVLATDGEPDTCADPLDRERLARGRAESAVANAHAAGIRTFVLSVGAGVSRTHLRRMANAGQGQPLDEPIDRFYVASDPAELEAALTSILEGARHCTLPLEGRADVARAASATVRLNGAPLQHGTDWRLLDDQTLELVGGACQAFRSDHQVELVAEFTCGAIVE